MGALEGSLSFKTFYVEGEPPNDFHQLILNQLQAHFFEPLSPVGDDERSIGWVPTQDPIATKFERDQVFFNQYIVFSMRIDKWSLPAPWVKALTRQTIAERMPELEAEEAKRQTEEGKLRPKAKLSKSEKTKIKQEVVTKIKQHIYPAMKIIDVVWNIDERKLRFWSTSNAVCDEFAELFEETFGLKIDQDSPFLMAQHLGFEDKELDEMVNADPWHPMLENKD